MPAYLADLLLYVMGPFFFFAWLEEGERHVFHAVANVPWQCHHVHHPYNHIVPMQAMLMVISMM
jgi:hypothetical protein